MSRDDYLFNSVDYFQVRQGIPEALRHEVAQFTDTYLLQTSPDELTTYLLDKYTILLPELLKEEISTEQQEADIDVTQRGYEDYGLRRGRGPDVQRGTRVTIYIPFSGTPDAFKIQPSTHSTTLPLARVREKEHELVFTVEGTSLSADGIKSQLDGFLRLTHEYLAWLKSNLDELNANLRVVAEEAIRSRRDKLLRDRSLMTDLGFKVRTRKDAPTTYVAPNVQRRIVARPPTARVNDLDPTLDDAEYQHILQIISSMVQVLERSPSSFSGMDEETLRSHLLVQLNGQYEGGATGETFNAAGKTDILIRANDRNIFIAECKIWSGPKGLSEAIDQILSYSTWRDTKVAIVLFVRNKEFTRVLESIPQAVKRHHKFKRELKENTETRYKYVFSSASDPDRELLVTVLAFHIPS